MAFPTDPVNGQTYTNANKTKYQYIEAENKWIIISPSGSAFELSNDLTPQLGGNLDANGHSVDMDGQNITNIGANNVNINSLTQTEINILDGATVSTAELNQLDGVDLSEWEEDLYRGNYGTGENLIEVNTERSSTGTIEHTFKEVQCYYTGKVNITWEHKGSADAETKFTRLKINDVNQDTKNSSSSYETENVTYILHDGDNIKLAGAAYTESTPYTEYVRNFKIQTDPEFEVITDE